MLYLIFVFAFSPVLAHAYLDPGTGAVLVNLIVAGIATLAFFMKGVFFRVIGKKNPTKSARKIEAKISLFSEGKQYWGTFEPLISALLKKNMHFNYYTLDIRDPALLIESEFMISKFLGYGNIGLAKASRIRSDILLSTTPNIGTPGYPVQRSPHVKRLIHILHSLNDISWYKSGSLDHYDEVILGGQYQAVAIIELEKSRNLQKKKLVCLGLPYLDTLLKERTTITKNNQNKTVLIGTSWGSKSLLRHYGTAFIRQLAVYGYDVIVRPHPQSYKFEPNLMEDIRKELSLLSNVVWDTAVSPSQSLSKADVLISDTSALRFDFAFVYEKPVITLSIPGEATTGYERDDLSEAWMDKAAQNIGMVLDETKVKDIERYVAQILGMNYEQRIREYRADLLCNLGKSGEAIAEYLDSLVTEGE